MGLPFLGTIDGPVILNEIAGQESYLAIKATSGFNASLKLYNNSNIRNNLYLDSTGNNLVLGSYNSSGALIDNPISINNASSGTITFNRPTTFSSAASFSSRLNLTAVAGITNSGDFWRDSTQETLSTYLGGVQQQLTGVIWSKTSTTTLSNWTTAATIIGAVGTGVGTLTLPANFLKVGKTIRLRLKGVLGDTSTAVPMLNVAVTLGGTSLGSTGANSLTTESMSGRVWALDFEFTCRSTGSSGTVIANGLWSLSNSATVSYCWGLGSSTAVTINTTTSLALNVTAACNIANASNKMSCLTATVEVLN